MYRQQARPDLQTTDDDRTFFYRPDPRYNESSDFVKPLVLTPVFVASILALAGLPDWAIPGALLTAIALYVAHRRNQKLPQATLQFDGNRLHVKRRSARSAIVISFEDLHDVRLDTKSMERLQIATSGAPELRHINSTVSPKIDTARIALEVRDGSVVHLTDNYLSHMDSTDWLLQIRRFLRKQGWIPLKERDGHCPGDRSRS